MTHTSERVRRTQTARDLQPALCFGNGLALFQPQPATPARPVAPGAPHRLFTGADTSPPRSLAPPPMPVAPSVVVIVSAVGRALILDEGAPADSPLPLSATLIASSGILVLNRANGADEIVQQELAPEIVTGLQQAGDLTYIRGRLGTEEAQGWRLALHHG